jgi:hypoxanthine-DNA glycosylase
MIKDERYKTITHPLQPFYDSHSKVLILGSFPSVKTREMKFFYGHPQNRFWPVLERLFAEPVPPDVPGRAAFLSRHHIACWDVIYQCDIIGSSDASIKNVIPTDLVPILAASQIKTIFCNGKTAGRLYAKHQERVLARPAIVLPSTSPANAAWSLDRLTEVWSAVKDVVSTVVSYI